MAWDKVLVSDGDAETLKLYQQLFSSNDDFESRGLSALHQIALCLDGRELKTYLRNCSPVEIDRVDDRGRTALHWAVKRGDLVNAELLLRNGSNPNIAAELGSNTLHFAAQRGEFDTINLLLKYGADVNHGNVSMLTPLMVLCESTKTDSARVLQLVHGGARLNEQDCQGATALMYASQGCSPPVLQCLLEHGARINMQTLDGETALIVAVQTNSHGAISVLINHGADLTYLLPSKRSLLHTAADHGDEATLAILTSAGICGIDVNHKDKDGATAWDLARARNGVTPEWRAAFADLVASINLRVPEPKTASDPKLPARAFPVPRVRLSDLLRIAEDSLY